nr:iron ABC transporter permease [Acuticoccus kalidii]
MVLLGLAVALCVSAAWSLTVGTIALPLQTIVAAIIDFDGSREHLIAATVRFPRLLAGLIAGSAFAVAGAIMQAVTNNPLASPGILGINAGAALAIVVALSVVDGGAAGVYVWCAFAGAAAAAIVVYAVGSAGRGGATPLKLALAGAILSAFVGSLTTAILIFDTASLDVVRVWSIGSVEGRSLATIMAIAPYGLVGLAGALLLRGQIATLSLGPEIAAQLGQNLAVWRLAAAAIVVLLAGGAVALTGPIGFVGLFVPHAARLIVGTDYRWIIPASALGGAFVVVFCDALLRAVLPDRDVPVGIAMALIGAPFFIHLARSRTARRPL